MSTLKDYDYWSRLVELAQSEYGCDVEELSLAELMRCFSLMFDSLLSLRWQEDLDSEES